MQRDMAANHDNFQHPDRKREAIALHGNQKATSADRRGQILGDSGVH
jgi:hypothetical protein